MTKEFKKLLKEVEQTYIRKTITINNITKYIKYWYCKGDEAFYIYMCNKQYKIIEPSIILDAEQFKKQMEIWGAK